MSELIHVGENFALKLTPDSLAMAFQNVAVLLALYLQFVPNSCQNVRKFHFFVQGLPITVEFYTCFISMAQDLLNSVNGYSRDVHSSNGSRPYEKQRLL